MTHAGPARTPIIRARRTVPGQTKDFRDPASSGSLLSPHAPFTSACPRTVGRIDRVRVFYRQDFLVSRVYSSGARVFFAFPDLRAGRTTVYACPQTPLRSPENQALFQPETGRAPVLSHERSWVFSNDGNSGNDVLFFQHLVVRVSPLARDPGDPMLEEGRHTVQVCSSDTQEFRWEPALRPLR